MVVVVVTVVISGTPKVVVVVVVSALAVATSTSSHSTLLGKRMAVQGKKRVRTGTLLCKPAYSGLTR